MLVVVFILLVNLIFTLGLDGPIVEVDSGKIQGYVGQSTGGRDFYSFQAIPYGQSPEGEFRFKPPRPFGQWTGIRNGSQLGPICPQRRITNFITIDGVEDCLFLNVYVPKLRGWPHRRLPVLFWIHGGGFILGSGRRDEYGPENQMDHNVVLVTINYRLGVLGFLGTNDSNAYGNNGMLDQVLALEWVQNNIKYFGGDPDQVTIVGESAGAVAVVDHVLSSLSIGLFSKAIAQSGSATMLFQKDALANAKAFAQKFNCTVNDTAELVQCMRNQTPYNIVLKTNPFLPIYWTPTAEPLGGPGFLTDTPRNILKSGRIPNEVPLIIGHNDLEGYAFQFLLVPLFQYTGVEYFEKQFPSHLPIFSDIQPNMTDAVNAIAEHYNLTNPQLDDPTFFTYVLSTVVGDCLVVAPISFDAEYLSKAGLPVYAYIYDHLGQYCYAGYVGGPCGVYSSHGDDLFIEFLFNSPTQPLNANDTAMSKIINDFWVQFAKESEVELSDNGPLWPKYRMNNPRYAEWNLSPAIRSGPLSTETFFWTETIYNIVQTYLSQ